MCVYMYVYYAPQKHINNAVYIHITYMYYEISKDWNYAHVHMYWELYGLSAWLHREHNYYSLTTIEL